MCCVKLQIPTSKTQRSSNLQTPTNHFPRLWALELGISLVLGAWGLVLTVAAGSNVAIPETVHFVMRAVTRASLGNRNRSMPTAPRNSDIRRNSRLRNSKSPAVAFISRCGISRNYSFFFTKQSRSDHNARPILQSSSLEQSDPRNNPTPGPYLKLNEKSTNAPLVGKE